MGEEIVSLVVDDDERRKLLDIDAENRFHAELFVLDDLHMLDGLETGLVLYLRQEGRGIGLINKVKAYALQDEGLDTVEANLVLGFRDEERDYAIAAHMIMSLNVKSIELMTNNPRKVEQLTHNGVHGSRRLPHVIPPNGHNRFYLETKRDRSGHVIDFASKPHLMEQSDPVLVDGMQET